MGIVLLIIACVIVAGLFLQAPSKGGWRPEFKAKQFMTKNEMEFLGRLEAAAPELRFHAQVCMGAILDPATSKHENVASYMRTRGKFSQKIIDYVAQSRATGEIVAIIELDDKTHSQHKDMIRDGMLFEAGYKVVRWQSKSKPSLVQIRSELMATFGSK
jgi:very-short-patch-repair endonuclease